MRATQTLHAVIPDNLFPLTVSFFEMSQTRDDFGGLDDTRWTRVTGMQDVPCLFTHAVRGAVRDEGMRKEYREDVRPRAAILLNQKLHVPYGAMAEITWPWTEAAPASVAQIRGAERRIRDGEDSDDPAVALTDQQITSLQAQITLWKRQAVRMERWRVMGIEHRPLSGHTRCPIEQLDGMVRT